MPTPAMPKEEMDGSDMQHESSAEGEEGEVDDNDDAHDSSKAVEPKGDGESAGDEDGVDANDQWSFWRKKARID